jgi:prepilin-type N-terminal cleavage/methylation domain-containing protein
MAYYLRWKGAMTHPGKKTVTRNDRGFSLIELLIVMLIIGVLATIAIASYPYMREKAGDAAAKSDLKNAAIFQEDYYGDYQTYADQASLDAVFVESENVTVTVISADMGGYEMSATHAASTATFCLSSANGAVVVC